MRDQHTLDRPTNAGRRPETPTVSLRSPVGPDNLVSSAGIDVVPTTDHASVFPQSVASGGPTATGVVLWTRVAPESYREGTPIEVVVAADASCEDAVLRSEIPAAEFGPQHDYTVRVDLDGTLEPNRHYYYRFVYDGVASRIGRCRTLPAADEHVSSLRLAVVGCQHYQNGYYGAYRHVAEADVDFVVHLGDYVYESADDRYRAPGATNYPGRDVALPSGHDVAWTLEDFRHVYRTYRSDRFLQSTHERHTVIRAWDDHAVTNNRYWDYDADAPAGPDHPRGDDPDFMRRLTAAGVQSWWEYTPARVEFDSDADHLHDALRLWRRFRFGDLLTLVVTDERLFRSKPPSVDGLLSGMLRPTRSPEDDDGTMLGDEQREWFCDAVRSADTRWTGWANEVLSMPFRVGAGRASVSANIDAWDGYPCEREAVFDALAEVENAVTLTGDMHTAMAGYQRTANGTPVGVEFMIPSVTSVNIAEAFGVDGGLRSRLTRPVFSKLVRTMNPHVQFFDSHHWGYATVEFTHNACTYTTYAVDKSTAEPSPDRTPVARFRVPSGRIDLIRRPV